MSKEVVLRQTEPREILQAAIEKKTTVIMTYLSNAKWHAAKVFLTNLGTDRLDIEISPRKNPYPMNLSAYQSVGMSFKHGYGKFIFETKIINLEISANSDCGGLIVLSMPEQLRLVPRRSYFRVNVPTSLKVDVQIWHRRQGSVPVDHRCPGSVVDLSAGGVQITIEASLKPNFKKGQFVSLCFTPAPYEEPLRLDGQVRTILPAAGDKNICFGLRLVGLEATSEGRKTLERLCRVVEKYHQMNQENTKQHNPA